MSTFWEVRIRRIAAVSKVADLEPLLWKQCSSGRKTRHVKAVNSVMENFERNELRIGIAERMVTDTCSTTSKERFSELKERLLLFID